MTDREQVPEPRRFPILWQGPRELMNRYRELGCPRSLPWRLAEPARRQAMRNHGQTLERLAQRGGLAPTELVCALRGQGLREIMAADEDEAVALLCAMVKGDDHG